MLFISSIGPDRQRLDPGYSVVKQNIAEVRVDCNFLFYVCGISSYPDEHRAETISRRIKKTGADSAISSFSS
jgi:hypothetical protein